MTTKRMNAHAPASRIGGWAGMRVRAVVIGSPTMPGPAVVCQAKTDKGVDAVRSARHSGTQMSRDLNVKPIRSFVAPFMRS